MVVLACASFLTMSPFVTNFVYLIPFYPSDFVLEWSHMYFAIRVEANP